MEAAQAGDQIQRLFMNTESLTDLIAESFFEIVVTETAKKLNHQHHENTLQIIHHDNQGPQGANNYNQLPGIKPRRSRRDRV